MLKQKVDQKKNILYLFVFIVIIVFIAFIFLKDRIRKDIIRPEGYASQSTGLLNLESSKTLDSSFLETPAFRELKDNRARKKTVNEIKVGKQNPFSE